MAKEMKRVLRENTTVDTQTGEVLKRKLRCSSQKSLASSSFTSTALAYTSRTMVFQLR